MIAPEPSENTAPRIELMALWPDLTLQGQGTLLRDATLIEIAPGQEVRVEFGILVSGTLGLEYHVTGGRRALAELLHSGDLVNRTGRHPQARARIVALSTACVLSVGVEDFELCLRHHRDVLRAYRRQVQDQAGRLRDHVNDLAVKTPLERIVSVLFELRSWPDTASNTATDVVLPILRKDIAAYTGMKPETVSRMLRKLKEDHLITSHSSDREIITLLDPPALRRIAEGGAPRGRRV